MIEIYKWNTMNDMLNDLPHNDTIVNNCIKAYSKINNTKYNKIIFLLKMATHIFNCR